MRTSNIDIPTAFSEELVKIGDYYNNVVVLNADLADSCKTEDFMNRFPERTFDLGVAEQSLPTIAAGLALSGKIPITNTFAVFTVFRGYDMVRLSIGYNNANVKLIGHGAGQAMGYAGPSHHTLEDIAAMRAIPNFCILSPADEIQIRKMMWWMVEHKGPVYLRMGRAKPPLIHEDSYQFVLGAIEPLTDGDDISIFTTGDIFPIAFEAMEILATKGVYAQIINVPSLKPIDHDTVVKYGKRTKGAITVEDHSVLGGLGSIISEIYAESVMKPVKRVGINDVFTESDDCEVLLDAYGVNANTIVKNALLILNKVTHS